MDRIEFLIEKLYILRYVNGGFLESILKKNVKENIKDDKLKLKYGDIEEKRSNY